MGIIIISYLVFSSYNSNKEVKFYLICKYLRLVNLLPVSVSSQKRNISYYIKSLINYLQLTSVLVTLN